MESAARTVETLRAVRAHLTEDLAAIDMAIREERIDADPLSDLHTSLIQSLRLARAAEKFYTNGYTTEEAQR